MITFGELLAQINDYNQNYTVTNIDKGNIERAANRAIEYVQARLGLPSDIDTYNFFYYQDQKFYDCPVDFNEFVQLYYNTDYSDAMIDYNTANRRWNLFKDTELLRRSGTEPSSNKVAVTRINGKNQLLLNGLNTKGPNIINTFDSINGLTFSSNIANQAYDTNTKKQGVASTRFDIVAGATSSTVSFTGLWSIRDAINTYSVNRMYMNFPTGKAADITSVELRFITSSGNYFSVSETNQVDGTAWVENAWSWLNFALNGMTETGSPDSTSITEIQVILNHADTFACENLRIDYLYQVTPDYLTLSYYSFYKGTDSTGATKKINLTADSDICSFGDIAPALIDPIALKAAMKLWPQLRSEPTFWQIYKADFDDVLKVYGRTWPRHRTTGIGGITEIIR